MSLAVNCRMVPIIGCYRASDRERRKILAFSRPLALASSRRAIATGPDALNVVHISTGAGTVTSNRGKCYLHWRLYRNIIATGSNPLTLTDVTVNSPGGVAVGVASVGVAAISIVANGVTINNTGSGGIFTNTGLAIAARGGDATITTNNTTIKWPAPQAAAGP